MQGATAGGEDQWGDGLCGNRCGIHLIFLDVNV